MIPKLRRKFISITAAALFAVIFLVVGSINCIFLYQNLRLLSRHLDQLLTLYGIPGQAGAEYAPEPHTNDPEGAAFQEGPEDGSLLPSPDRDFPMHNKPAEDFSLLPRFENGLRMRTDGCVIILDESGAISEIRQDNSGQYSTSEMSEIASKIKDSSKKEGWYRYYKYRVSNTKTPDGMTVAGVINASSVIYSVLTMLSVSALIGIIAFLVVLLIIIFASGRAIRPIAESYARQRQFVTDAGHELKTPLTVISANNELSRMIYGDSEWFDGIDRQVGKMNGLVRSLITLAKLDEEPKPVFAAFDLSDAVYDTAKSFENLIHTRGRLLTLDIAENISFTGDESRIRQLVSILMDNAIKYCDEQGKIAVRLSADKGICLQITNDYRDCDKFEPEKVFGRFYRADSARTPDGSYGLGLSIAKSVVELHRGRIRARVLDHGRVQFEVTLPTDKKRR